MPGNKLTPDTTLRGLLDALDAVTQWLTKAGTPFAIIGGVAASIHGKPRVTKDVDLVVMCDDSLWPRLLQEAANWGLRPRISDALEFAKTTRVLLLVHEPSKIEVDLSFGMLPFEQELVSCAKLRTVRHVTFPLAAAEDIIVMKALALRPRDIADIEGILESVEGLDLERVRTTVKQLSTALETEDHSGRLDEILRRVSPRT